MHVFQYYPVGLQIEFIALSFGPRGPISLGVMRNSLPFYSRHGAAPARAHSTSLVSSTAVAVTNSQQYPSGQSDLVGCSGGIQSTTNSFFVKSDCPRGWYLVG